MKKRLVSVLLCACMMFSLAACGEDYEENVETENVIGSSIDNTLQNIADQAESTGDSWVIYWYLCGSDLETNGGFATTDLNEMMQVALPENVNVVIQTGGAAQWQNELINPSALTRLLYSGSELYVLEEQPLASMGDPQTLANFLQFASTYCQADHTALIFWNHGGGSLSGAAFDEIYDYDSITLPELYAALDAVYGADSQNPALDLIGFDTCLMATIDVADVCKNFAHYMVASEETEPGNGWYYTGWLDALAKNPAMDAEELGATICATFYEGCEMVGTESAITLSVTDLSKVDALVEAYTTFGQDCLVLASENPGFFAQFARSAVESENYGGNNREEGFTNMVDLGHLARNTAEYIPSSASVQQALNEAVVYSVNGDYRAESTGLSCFYSYDADMDNLVTYDQIGVGFPFKHLFAYELTGNISDATAQYLENLNISELSEMVTLADTDWDGMTFDIDEEGNSFINLGSEANEILSDIMFTLFYVDTDNDLMMYMGTDNNITADWDNGIFIDNFFGQWGCINDIPVFMELTYSDEKYNLYSVPVLLNGEEYNLQVAYDFYEEAWSVLGGRQGLDDSGMASKEMRQLVQGDVIDIIWQFSNLDAEDFEMYTVATVEVDDSFTFTEGALPDGKYGMVFVMTDAYGNEAMTDAVLFDVIDSEIYTTVVE